MAKTINDLDDYARDLLTTGMAWADRFWDESVGLLWAPGDRPEPPQWAPSSAHTVRDSVWYALGLLLRDGPGDRARAVRALGVILYYQFNEPGQPYHGTFYRSPEEVRPPQPAQEWKHYDPNWREFIMTTIAIILAEYEQWLPHTLVRKMDGAFRLAVEGALARNVSARYTNIALMNAFMLWYAGTRLQQPNWVEAGESMAREVYRLFKLHNVFEEYNSPTYYGVDLYALALWRAYAVSPVLRDLGAEMEALLWTDIARYYHAGLRNIAGPYDRAYGMNMRAYAAVVGAWIWLVTGKERAPFPDPERGFAHAHDFLFAPLPAILGAPVAPAARAHFLAFQGERQLEQVISDTPRRVATAWLGTDVMIGAEQGPKRGYAQFHPATVHWRIGADVTGWMRLVHLEPVEARASRNCLEISGAGDVAFQVCAPGLHAGDVTPWQWRLPGLTVDLQANRSEIQIEDAGEWLVVRYPAQPGQPVEMKLNLTAGRRT